jgi:hypothetical protein
MQCERFESRLNEVLDARQPLSSASDLEEHIRGCGQCRELARAYESALVGLRQVEVPPVPAWLTRRIVGELRRPRVIRFPRRRAALAAAAAAVLLAVVCVPWLLTREAGQAPIDEGPVRVAETNQSYKVDVTQADEQTTEPRESDQHRSDTQLVSRMRSTIALLDPTQLKADDLMSSSTTWAHEVADGLEPVTKPTVGAISGFLQLWGVGDEGRRS